MANRELEAQMTLPRGYKVTELRLGHFVVNRFYPVFLEQIKVAYNIQLLSQAKIYAASADLSNAHLMLL